MMLHRAPLPVVCVSIVRVEEHFELHVTGTYIPPGAESCQIVHRPVSKSPALVIYARLW